MNKTLAISRRILSQFAHDKRTLALLFVAPILVLWLLSVLLGTNAYVPTVATVDLPGPYQNVLKAQDVHVIETTENKAAALLKDNKVDAVLSIEKGTTTLNVWAEGSNSGKTAAVLKVVGDTTGEFNETARETMEKDVEAKKQEMEEAKKKAEQKQREIKKKLENARANAAAKQAEIQSKQKQAQASLMAALETLPPENQAALAEQFSNIFASMGSVNTGSITGGIGNINMNDIGFDVEEFELDIDSYLPVQKMETTYLHGSEDWDMFDFYGPIFIGIFIFVFTFLTSGMSLVNERSAGTMARFLATPVRPWQILGGYSIGFGLLSLVQVAVILTAALKFIGFPNEGNVLFVVCIAVSLAVASVTLGLLVSGLASNAFQVIQLMLMFIVPQILLSGLFDLSGAPGWLQAISDYLPLTYGVDALREVMLRGSGIEAIGKDLLVVWEFIVGFFVLAALGFRKKHAKAHRKLTKAK